MLVKRLISAFILIPVVLWIAIAAPPFIYIPFVCLVSLLLSYELSNFRKKLKYTSTMITYIFIVILYFIKYCNIFQPDWLGAINAFQHSDYVTLIIICHVFTVSLRYVFNRSFKGILSNITFTVFILLYAGTITSYMVNVKYIYLIAKQYQSLSLIGEDIKYIGTYYLLFFIFICWAYDTGAYFVGKYWGSIKLGLPASPKKSWAGVIGGLACTSIAYAIIYHSIHYYHSSLAEYTLFGNKPIWYGLLVTFLLGIMCQVGDLVVSIFKRSANLKNSSNLIAGHGGLLDRLDSNISTVFVGYMLLEFGVI